MCYLSRFITLRGAEGDPAPHGHVAAVRWLCGICMIRFECLLCLRLFFNSRTDCQAPRDYSDLSYAAHGAGVGGA